MFRSLSVGLALIASSLGAQSLELIADVDLPTLGPTFGGLSGLEMNSPDHALTVSDRGQFFDLTLIRDVTGKLTKITAAPAALHDTQRDSEGLAIGPSGAFVSMEGPAMVRVIGGHALPRHRNFRNFKGNGGLEALAIDAQGRLYTLAEQSGDSHDPLIVYRYENQKWTRAYAIPRNNRFLPVGADFGPDGLLYLLERQFSPLGFRTQIRRFDLSQPGLGEVRLLRTRPLHHGNLEGIAVWENAQGITHLTLIADNNMQQFQRNHIVEYRLVD